MTDVQPWYWDDDPSLPMLMDPETGDVVLGCHICKPCQRRGSSCMSPSDSYKHRLTQVPVLEARVRELEALIQEAVTLSLGHDLRSRMLRALCRQDKA